MRPTAQRIVGLAWLGAAVLLVSARSAGAEGPNPFANYVIDSTPIGTDKCLPDFPDTPPPLAASSETDPMGHPYHPELASWLHQGIGELAVEYAPDIYESAKASLEAFRDRLEHDYGGCPAIGGSADGFPGCPAGAALQERIDAARARLGGSKELTDAYTAVVGAAIADANIRASTFVTAGAIRQTLDLQAVVVPQLIGALEGFRQRRYMLTFLGKVPAQAVAEYEAKVRAVPDYYIENDAKFLIAREQLGVIDEQLLKLGASGFGGDTITNPAEVERLRTLQSKYQTLFAESEIQGTPQEPGPQLWLIVQYRCSVKEAEGAGEDEQP